MIRKWLKRILGINEIENRVVNLEREKADLEGKVIESEKEKDLMNRAVTRSVSLSEIVNEVQGFLGAVNIQITDQNSGSALVALEATDVIKKYGFERYVAPLEVGYPSQVITIAELQEHPELYMHKLSKGFFHFPVGLNFDEINETLGNRFGSIELDLSTAYSNNGCFTFVLKSLLERVEGSDRANEVLVQATQLSHLRRAKCSSWVHMDTIDFLANYDGIVGYIKDLPDVNTSAKISAISAMEVARFTYLTALEIVGTTRIRYLSDLLKYDKAEESHTITGDIEDYNPNQQLKLKLKASLLFEPKGTSYEDIEKLLSIISMKRFRALASEVTSKILANDKARKGLTYKIDKPLEDYSVGEAVVLASYFARNVITQYRKLEDSVNEIFMGKPSSEISGKCTDYTGLALHYLREYLVPMQPAKFRNWQFGVEQDHIGDYNHCYIKALHINPDLTVDVYFLDPTSLADRGIKELKSPQKVIQGLDAKNFPLMIERDAEDLLYAAKERID